jgi:hypothetical protein
LVKNRIKISKSKKVNSISKIYHVALYKAGNIKAKTNNPTTLNNA